MPDEIGNELDFFSRPNKTYSSSTKNLQLSDNQGLILELGLYVAEIQQGSKAAKDKGISVGDRILNVSHPKFLFFTIERFNLLPTMAELQL